MEQNKSHSVVEMTMLTYYRNNYNCIYVFYIIFFVTRAEESNKAKITYYFRKEEGIGPVHVCSRTAIIKIFLIAPYCHQLKLIPGRLSL